MLIWRGRDMWARWVKRLKKWKFTPRVTPTTNPPPPPPPTTNTRQRFLALLILCIKACVT